jgi:crossover junction endodeoxyribonuclease RuvC
MADMNAPQERILGLDPGLAILGFGAIDGIGAAAGTMAGAQVIDFGIIETQAKTPVGDRLNTLYDDLHSVIEQIKPTRVALEKLFFYRMGNTILVAPGPGSDFAGAGPAPTAGGGIYPRPD